MQHIRTIVSRALLLAALACAPLTAHAQPTVLAPTETLRLAWEAPPVADGGRNAPTSYRVETFTESAQGVVITGFDLPLVTTADLAATRLPASPFLVAVRAVNAAGDSDRSNVLGPFVVAQAPTAPVNLRRVSP